jgi:SAM-dependent methyltransferase
MYRIASGFIIPYLSKKGLYKAGDKVAEIGCAEGGVLAAFVENGCGRAFGTDIIQKRLDLGKKMSAIADLPIEFENHNIVDEEIPKDWLATFDLVILRDVIEHLDNPATALKSIKMMLKPGGSLFVTFPPYYSPFGGHQHTLVNFWGRLPYIHLLPKFIFERMIASGRKNDIGEVQRLRGIALTPGKFKKAATAAGFSIFNEEYYFLRPIYKIKFNLPSIRTTPISFLPCIKNFFSLEAMYVLKND